MNLKSKNQQKNITLYLRNIIFGIEDSLVSTVGLISGMAVVDVPKETIILAGFILIAVEAFSMGVGSFLTEHSVDEYIKQKETSMKIPLIGGWIMFFSYFITGFIPLSPYFFTKVQDALWLSIFLSFLGLFFLGFLSAKFFKINVFRKTIEMLFIGGIAITIGVIVGIWVNKYIL